MPRKIEKQQRGVYEREPGSDIWWIRYADANGREHREKVGRRGDALKLYKLRKSDVLRGVKMPVNMKHRGLRFKVIGKEAIEWYENHGQKDLRSFRIRMNIVLKDFGDRIADDIKPSEIDIWLGAHKWAPLPRTAIRASSARHSRSRLPMARFPRIRRDWWSSVPRTTRVSDSSQ